jgi:hypothetical protein
MPQLHAIVLITENSLWARHLMFNVHQAYGESPWFLYTYSLDTLVCTPNAICVWLRSSMSGDETKILQQCYILPLELGLFTSLRLALTEFKHINKHEFVRMWKKFTPASGSSKLPCRTRPIRRHDDTCCGFKVILVGNQRASQLTVEISWTYSYMWSQPCTSFSLQRALCPKAAYALFMQQISYISNAERRQKKNPSLLNRGRVNLFKRHSLFSATNATYKTANSLPT